MAERIGVKGRVFRRAIEWIAMSVPLHFQPISCFHPRVLRDSGPPKRQGIGSPSIKLLPQPVPALTELIVIGPTLRCLRTIPSISGTFSALVPSSAGYIWVRATGILAVIKKITMREEYSMIIDLWEMIECSLDGPLYLKFIFQ
jgi:hypothetical protein